MGRGQQTEAAVTPASRTSPRKRSNKRLVEDLRMIHVVNPHDFYNGETPQGQVFVSYRPGDSWHSPGWHVSRKGYILSDDKFRPAKEFVSWEGSTAKERKEQALADAQAWASERYGITEWGKDPFGSYGEASFVAERLAGLERELERAEASKETEAQE